jgi:hypothetical protein
MSDRLHVATRKGLFTFDRGAAGWTVGRRSFLGDPVTIVLDDARDDTLYAALNLGHFGVKLHRSKDGGQTWEERTAPSYPEIGTGSDAEKAEAPSVKQIWALEAGGTDQSGVLWAGTIPGGLFRSDDGGGSWDLIESLWNRPERADWFGGGYDDPGIHSICVHPQDPNRITVGVSCGGVWVSRDGGESWDCKAKGMYAEYMPPERRDDPSIQDPHRVVQSPTSPEVLWAQHHNGVFRTRNGADSWTALENVPPATFGFAVAVHPKEPDTAWFVPAVKDECRIPVDGRVVVARTRDGGKSFEELRRGLPQEDAYHLIFRHALDIDRTGSRLAMGSTTGNLWLSDDGGDSWDTLSSHLPPIYQVLFP